MVATANTLKPALVRHYSVEEYLDVELQEGERYQYFDGEIIKMPGGTLRHNTIIKNLIFGLETFLDEQEDKYLFGSDQKIYLPKYNFYLYPDAIVVSDTPVVSEKGHAILNPVLIVEVLSKSTADNDKGQKFMEYQSIDTFKEYVLVRQDVPEVTTFFREAPDLWRSSETEGLENSVFLKSLNISL
ncbi:MAG: hypothetical protein RLZZ292_1651, partial [Bacteroidota bacterium]